MFRPSYFFVGPLTFLMAFQPQMFWKRASEWANVAASSPPAIRFGVAASKGYEKLVIIPNDPTSKDFLASVEKLTNEACVPEARQAHLDDVISDLETTVSRFAALQRLAIEKSIGEVYEGLRDVLKSLEGAIASSENLEQATEGASSRLTSLQHAKSYDEVLHGIKKEISTLNSAVEKHREDAKIVRKVASKHVEELRTKLKTAEKAVRTDHLTKLGNRSAFDFLLSVAITKISQGEKYCLAILDIDKFKQINDNFGHLFGDAALVEFAKRLNETFSLPGTSVVRFGGDEFAVLYRGSKVQFEAKLERVNSVLARLPMRYDDETVTLKASFGAIELNARHTPESAVSDADNAMYFAKRQAA